MDDVGSFDLGDEKKLTVDMDQEVYDHALALNNDFVASGSGSGPSGQRKKRKHIRKSEKAKRCWKHFKMITELMKDGVTSDVQCNHCGVHYFVKLRRNGTSTLLRHMKNGCSKTPASTPSSSRKLDMMDFREVIVVAIIEHDLPFYFVEYKRIREAFVYANPSIEFWSRNTAATGVLKIYEKEKLKLKEVLTTIPSRVCLTTDLWRAITIEGYICLTTHYIDSEWNYIDSEWNLKSNILSFCAFPPPHTGVAIAMKLIELLKEWRLEKKVFSLTVDNASSNDNMQEIVKRKLHKDLVCYGEFFHIRCSANILNLIVQDGLAVIGETLEKIKESVKFVKAFDSREDLFRNCVETVGIQSIASLVLDVKTTHHMLSRAIEFKDALRNLSGVEASYKFFPSELEWKRGE